LQLGTWGEVRQQTARISPTLETASGWFLKRPRRLGLIRAGCFRLLSPGAGCRQLGLVPQGCGQNFVGVNSANYPKNASTDLPRALHCEFLAKLLVGLAVWRRDRVGVTIGGWLGVFLVVNGWFASRSTARSMARSTARSTSRELPPTVPRAHCGWPQAVLVWVCGFSSPLFRQVAKGAVLVLFRGQPVAIYGVLKRCSVIFTQPSTLVSKYSQPPCKRFRANGHLFMACCFRL